MDNKILKLNNELINNDINKPLIKDYFLYNFNNINSKSKCKSKNSKSMNNKNTENNKLLLSEFCKKKSRKSILKRKCSIENNIVKRKVKSIKFKNTVKIVLIKKYIKFS